MRETLDGFRGGLQIGGRMITNLCYADDIILLATSEAELQELVDRLDRVSRKYSLLINVDKTKCQEGGFYCPDSASSLNYKGSASLNGLSTYVCVCVKTTIHSSSKVTQLILSYVNMHN